MSLLEYLRRFPPENYAAMSVCERDAHTQQFLVHMPLLFKEHWKLLRKPEYLIAAFGQLDPAVNSIAWLGLIDNSVDNEANSSLTLDSVDLPTRLAELLANFDPIQIRYIAITFRQHVERVATGNVLPARTAVELIAHAIARLDPENRILTSLHVDLLNLARRTHNVDIIIPLLRKPTVFFPTTTSAEPGKPLCDPTITPRSFIMADEISHPLTSRDVTSYFIAAGQSLVDLRRWDDAVVQFRRCVGHAVGPGASSENHVVAYKRLLLANMLAGTARQALPPFLTKAAVAFLGARAQAYVDLDAAFFARDVARLRAAVENHKGQWHRDGTEPLVNLVCAAFQRHQIRRLADVYASLPVAVVRTSTQSGTTGRPLPSDEKVVALLNEMIAAREIDAVIASTTNRDGVSTSFCLRFLPSSSSSSSSSSSQNAVGVTAAERVARDSFVRALAAETQAAVDADPLVARRARHAARRAQLWSGGLGGGGGGTTATGTATGYDHDEEDPHEDLSDGNYRDAPLAPLVEDESDDNSLDEDDDTDVTGV